MAYKIKTKKKKGKEKFDLTSYIIAYESGELSNKETLKLFQHLEDNGMAYSLQGHYGRTATALIGAGLIKPNPKFHTKKDIEKLKQQHKLNQVFSNL
jgi:hypothetical protein